MQAIIDGKLYDTEGAERVAEGTFVEVFRTKDGRWFKKEEPMLGLGCQIIPIDQKEAKSLVGFHSPDSYDKYFS